MSNQIVERKNQIIKIIESGEISSRLNSLFGKDDGKSQKFKATLLNIALDQSLQSCTPASIVKSALMLAELDLPLAKALGQCYIVRYKQDAEAVVGAKGWLALAERAGKTVKAKPVYSCDQFEMIDNGFDETIILKPNLDERREFEPKWVEEHLKGILVAVRDNSTHVITNTWVSVGKIKQIAGKSPSRGKGFSPYNDWAIEMYQAKAIKYVLSKTAMNETIGRAVEIDNQLDTKAVEDRRDEEKRDSIDLNAMLNEPIDVEAETTEQGE